MENLTERYLVERIDCLIRFLGVAVADAVGVHREALVVTHADVNFHNQLYGDSFKNLNHFNNSDQFIHS